LQLPKTQASLSLPESAQFLRKHALGAPAIQCFCPDGSPIDGAVPQQSIAACVETSIWQRSAQLGLAIDHDIAFLDREAMDHALAIDGMFTVSGEFAMSRGSVSAETLAESVESTLPS
jgi:hypothetical protein